MELRRAQVFLSATTGDDQSGASGLSGAATMQRQPASESRVTPQEAESLPLAELKARLRQEASADEEAATASEASTGGLALDTDTNADAAGVAGVESPDVADTKDATADTQAGAAKAQPDDIALLQTQLNSMSGNLKTLSDERKQLLAEIQAMKDRETAAQQQGETARMQQQHQQVEAHIRTLPEVQQPVARQHYMNQLGQAALNDYQRHLVSEQAKLADTELRLAVQQAPSVLGEIATFVAAQRDIPPDVLKPVIESANMRNLLASATTREGYVAVMATAGEWIDFYANQEAGRLASEKEARRVEAAASGAQRDTPAGGNAAGGDLGMSRRIESMSREEFFQWKAAQLKRQQQQGNVRYM